jgi:hypothetical protein
MINIKLISAILYISVGIATSVISIKVSAEDVPEPECISGGIDSSACGYNCKRSLDFSEVACAEWPKGKCEATIKDVMCGPPAPANWDRSYRNSRRDRDRDRDTRRYYDE